MKSVRTIGDKSGKAVGTLAELALRCYSMLLILGWPSSMFIDWFFVIPAYRDLGADLLTDALSTISTIIFSMALIEFGENHQCKLARDRVMGIVGSGFQSVLYDLILLRKGTYERCLRRLLEVEEGRSKTTAKLYVLDYK